jgi:hypothetical protein
MGTEAVELQSSDDKESDSQKFSKKHGPKFIIIFCISLMLIYIIFSILAHCAYREFKGVAEDCAGGSINLTDGNILYYGIIAKREQDAIDEKKELEERARKRQEARLGANGLGAAMMMDPEMQPMMME